ncbi:hypothetical protein Rvan_0541 [Rhodomicrobium vannielii ATCC 17100]|uniref:Uncharacterized protein n=1 Tax=Rhodomicrobium vannielii (strain ATCC 17100 / DSM 162 / LMG 4299 / NCIMB 10020 / ATH 3.1.1) TaxID=648757 RepID=E3HYT1_RHOVT|nr:hypothetical protein [Rhodomicrobium vannielii]ADP69822.1 hypothetical protein Rvan_0541 [Rhodomicrobium vannielii ATCC 17100]
MRLRFAFWLASLAAVAGTTPMPHSALAQGFGQPMRGPTNILGRSYPGKIKAIGVESMTVNLREGGPQTVLYSDIWRLRRSFASDEPNGSSIVDFGNNRMFIAASFDALVAEVSKKLPLTKFTAPNGDTVYLVANKVTDITGAIPGLHNPASKTVVGTRNGSQQVLETIADTKKVIAAASIAR